MGVVRGHQVHGTPRARVPLADSVTVAQLGEDTKAILYLYPGKAVGVEVNHRHIQGTVAAAARHALSHEKEARALEDMAVRCCPPCPDAVAWLASLAPAVEVADTA